MATVGLGYGLHARDSRLTSGDMASFKILETGRWLSLQCGVFDGHYGVVV